MVATKVRSRLNGAAEVSPGAPAQEAIRLPLLDVQTLHIPIRSVPDSPLVVHKFSEKARKQIKDKQGKKAKVAKEARNPEAEYLAALYVMPGTGEPGSKTAKYGVPAAGFKRAAVSACRYIDGINMTFANGAFHVMEDAGGLVELKHKSPPQMREDTVRLQGPSKPLDLRYRPEFKEWSCVLRVRYNAAAISAEQIVNLFHHAGFHIGICEMRAEKGLACGLFEVVTK